MKQTKKSKQPITFLLAAIVLFACSFTSMAAQIRGNVDEIQNDSISGWVWDSQSPETPLTVSVFVVSQTESVIYETTTQAGFQRDDVSASGYGNGACGFWIPINWSQFPDGAYTVYAFAEGQMIGGERQYYKGYPRLRSLGVFKTTGYCPCRTCSSNWGTRTSTGTTASANHTIAVDPRVIPYGTKVMINGVIYTAEDKGSGVKGKHIDIFYNTHSEARAQGVKYAEVFVFE